MRKLIAKHQIKKKLKLKIKMKLKQNTQNSRVKYKINKGTQAKSGIKQK